MKILCIGDIVGKPGRHLVQELVPKLKEEYALDLVVANAENAAGGSGVTPRIAGQLLRFGCDVLTMGDHVWDRPELAEGMTVEERVLRPANFPEGTPGRGYVIVSTPAGQKVGVINVLGRVFMKYHIDCPFRAVERIAAEIRTMTPVIVVDVHAETTSEKVAMGHFADGRVSAVVGTHTHVQTADDKVLPQGTAYITDLGMTGPHDSVIGQNKEKILKRFLTSIPVRFEVAKEDPCLNGVLIEIDEENGKAKSIERIQRRCA